MPLTGTLYHSVTELPEHRTVAVCLAVLPSASLLCGRCSVSVGRNIETCHNFYGNILELSMTQTAPHHWHVQHSPFICLGNVPGLPVRCLFLVHIYLTLKLIK